MQTIAEDDAFIDMVGEEAKGYATPEFRLLLRQSEMLDRWLDALKVLKRRVEAQLVSHNAEVLGQQQVFMSMPGSKGAWFTYKAEKDRKRGQIVWFKTYVEQRISEAQSLIKARTTDQTQEIKRLKQELKAARAELLQYRVGVLDTPAQSE